MFAIVRPRSEWKDFLQLSNLDIKELEIGGRKLEIWVAGSPRSYADLEDVFDLVVNCQSFQRLGRVVLLFFHCLQTFVAFGIFSSSPAFFPGFPRNMQNLLKSANRPLRVVGGNPNFLNQKTGLRKENPD